MAEEREMGGERRERRERLASPRLASRMHARTHSLTHTHPIPSLAPLSSLPHKSNELATLKHQLQRKSSESEIYRARALKAETTTSAAAGGGLGGVGSEKENAEKLAGVCVCCCSYFLFWFSAVFALVLFRNSPFFVRARTQPRFPEQRHRSCLRCCSSMCSGSGGG
jgi:hypothetical protein